MTRKAFADACIMRCRSRVLRVLGFCFRSDFNSGVKNRGCVGSRCSYAPPALISGGELEISGSKNSLWSEDVVDLLGVRYTDTGLIFTLVGVGDAVPLSSLVSVRSFALIGFNRCVEHSWQVRFSSGLSACGVKKTLLLIGDDCSTSSAVTSTSAAYSTGVCEKADRGIW